MLDDPGRTAAVLAAGVDLAPLLGRWAAADGGRVYASAVLPPAAEEAREALELTGADYLLLATTGGAAALFTSAPAPLGVRRFLLSRPGGMEAAAMTPPCAALAALLAFSSPATAPVWAWGGGSWRLDGEG